MEKETKQIIVFIALAYLLTWIVNGVQLLINSSTNSVFFIALSAFGPGIAALIVYRKTIGIKAFLKHSFTFEQRLSYYVIFLAYAVWRYFLCMFVGVRVDGTSLILPILLIPVCLLTGGNEELGWRFLQPQLEKKMHSVLAVIIFVFIWAFWHLPLYFIPGGREDSIAGFFGFLFFLGFCFTNAFTLVHCKH